MILVGIILGILAILFLVYALPKVITYQKETEPFLKEVEKLNKVKKEVEFHLYWELYNGNKEKVSELQDYFDELKITLKHMKKLKQPQGTILI